MGSRTNSCVCGRLKLKASKHCGICHKTIYSHKMGEVFIKRWREDKQFRTATTDSIKEGIKQYRRYLIKKNTDGNFENSIEDYLIN
jgi:hypothetical protein